VHSKKKVERKCESSLKKTPTIKKKICKYSATSTTKEFTAVKHKIII